LVFSLESCVLSLSTIPNLLEFTLDVSLLASLSGVLDRLSKVTINVYDFYIILYFYLGQIMRNKPNFQGCNIL
jgi:hypothetical protein